MLYAALKRGLLCAVLAIAATACAHAAPTAVPCTDLPEGSKVATATLSCSVAPGNVVIVGFYLDTSPSQTVTPPAGFTQFDTDYVSPDETVYFWHAVSSGDSGSYTFTWPTAAYIHAHGWVVTGASTTNPIDAFGHASTSSSATVSSPTETPSNDDVPLADFAQGNNNSAPTYTAGWTQDNAGTSGAIYYEQQHGPATTSAVNATITYTSAPALTLSETILVAPGGINDFTLVGAGGVHQSVTVTLPGQGPPALPDTITWFGQFGSMQTQTQAQLQPICDYGVGQFLTTASTPAHAVTSCAHAGMYFSMNMGEPNTSGHDVDMPWHTGETGTSCPSAFTTGSNYWANTGSGSPDFTNTTAGHNWGVFLAGDTGNQNDQFAGASNLSSGNYHIFMNVASSELDSTVTSFFENCTTSQGDPLSDFDFVFEDNTLVGSQAQGWDDWGTQGYDAYVNIGAQSGGPPYASLVGISAPGTFFSGAASLNSMSSQFGTNNASTSDAYSSDLAVGTAWQTAEANVFRAPGTCVHWLFNDLLNSYQAKYLQTQSCTVGGVNEHANIKSDEETIQPDLVLWENLDIGTMDYWEGDGNLYTYLDDGADTGAWAPGTANFQHNLRVHYLMTWLLSNDKYPKMMGSWVNFCGSITGCTNIFPGDFAAPSGRIEAFPSEALGSGGVPCGENEQNYNGTGNPCTTGGVRDPVWEAGCSTAPSCLFVVEFSHFWVDSTYNRSTWAQNAVDHGDMAVIVNLSGATQTLSTANLQSWLGTSFEANLNNVLTFCTPNSSYFGTSGTPVYAHVASTDSTQVCSNTDGDVLAGGTLSTATSLSSIIGTTLPDGDGIVLVNR